MLLIRFATMIMAVVAAVVGVAVFDTWWAVGLTVALALVLLAVASVDVFRQLDDDDGAPAATNTATDDPLEAPGADAPRRVLLATTGPIDRRVIDEVLDGDDPADVGVLVVVPTLVRGGLGYVSADVKAAVRRARATVDQTLKALKAAGISASGRTGAADPAIAIADGLNTYTADLVVLARNPAAEMRDFGVVPAERVAADADVPLRELELSTARRFDSVLATA